MLNKLWKSEKGFTLMELIIVIVILGILALIAVPRLLGFTQTAAESADEEYAAVIGRAAELYYAANKDTLTLPMTNAYTDLTSGTNALAPVYSAQSTKYAGSCTVEITASGLVNVDLGSVTDVWQSQ